MQKESEFDHLIDWFRQASPYINAHRGKTFVVALSGDAVDTEGFASLVHDMALLSHLGVRLVLVYGIRAQIEALEREKQHQSSIVNNLRVTDSEAMQSVIQAAGTVRVLIESAFSSSLPNTPMSGSRLGIVSGNFVTARPYGIHEGVDYQHTGIVRRVHANAIHRQLDAGNIVLLSPLGYSPTGETFNLHADDVATEAAIALGADKLLFLLDSPVCTGSDNRLLRQSTPDKTESMLENGEISVSSHGIIRNAIRAVRTGIKRAHMLNRESDGALLKELFTRDGVGTMISADNYEGMRPAGINDVGGIISLISPFEADGTLVRRSREQLEMEIDRFTVIERDGTIVACAALYKMGRFAEIACVVTHRDYRNSGRAELLLEHLEKQARESGLDTLFVFTTRTRHWFIEQGFTPASLNDLPAERQDSYNYKRNSSVLIKSLQ